MTATKKYWMRAGTEIKAVEVVSLNKETNVAWLKQGKGPNVRRVDADKLYPSMKAAMGDVGPKVKICLVDGKVTYVLFGEHGERTRLDGTRVYLGSNHGPYKTEVEAYRRLVKDAAAQVKEKLGQHKNATERLLKAKAELGRVNKALAAAVAKASRKNRKKAKRG